jgi:hypothetical protein
MGKLSGGMVARELVHLRARWQGTSNQDYAQYLWDEVDCAVTLTTDTFVETYVLNEVPADAWHMSLDDFSRHFLQPLLASKLGPRQPTLLDLLKTATTALAQLKSRLEEAR